MTTLGTHPFIPSASKLGAPIHCQHCPHDAAHAVHDWLTDGGFGTDVLSAITPEEMVRLENLPNSEPFEDGGGYLTRVELPRATVSNPTMLARLAERLRAGR